jgi:hypothetical protein
MDTIDMQEFNRMTTDEQQRFINGLKIAEFNGEVRGAETLGLLIAIPLIIGIIGATVLKCSGVYDEKPIKQVRVFEQVQQVQKTIPLPRYYSDLTVGNNEKLNRRDELLVQGFSYDDAVKQAVQEIDNKAAKKIWAFTIITIICLVWTIYWKFPKKILDNV